MNVQSPDRRPDTFGVAEAMVLGQRAGKKWVREVSSGMNRRIRVFVSSTFKDMQGERDQLAKVVFPALRSLCRTRSVEFTDVDLRWGVPDEPEADGQVLPICFAEIDRCRPFFIGLLADRYGWVPEAIPSALIQRAPWLVHYSGRSVTELEIRYAVLNQPTDGTCALFYCRDHAYADSQKETSAESKQKLDALKAEIRQGGHPVRGYSDPVALGELVLNDLTREIDRLFPAGEAVDPLEQEAAEHEAFARARTRVFEGRIAELNRLDTWASGDGPPLVVTGESGSGKSALLSQWALHYQERHSDVPVLLHVIGSRSESAQWPVMVRRVMTWLQRRFDLPGQVPTEEAQLPEAFAQWLAAAAARGRYVLVIDGLNHLEETPGALDLAWLPAALPPQSRLLLSATAGRSVAETERRWWGQLLLGPIPSDERQTIIERFLRIYGKQLSRKQAERISTAPGTASPLYLTALLDELRFHGVFETLDETIDSYLSAPTVAALLDKVLARYERDYERDRPNLVRDTAQLLWAARRGLSEHELLKLLGTAEQPLSRLLFSPLYLAMEHLLTVRSGLVGFFHGDLRSAVERRYLPSPSEQRQSHLRVAALFREEYDPFEAVGETAIDFRKVEELPWQLARAGEWERLYRLLSNQHFISQMWARSQEETLRQWAELEDCSEYRMVEAYRQVAEAGVGIIGYNQSIAELLLRAGHVAESEWLFYVTGYASGQLQDSEFRAQVLNSQVAVARRKGDLETALRLAREQEQLCRGSGYREGLQGALNSLAIISMMRRDWTQAEKNLAEVEDLCRRSGDMLNLQACHGNLGMLCRDRGDVDGAVAHFTEQVRICRAYRYRQGLANGLKALADLKQESDDWQEAIAPYQEAFEVYQELGLWEDAATCFNALVPLVAQHGRTRDALQICLAWEQRCRHRGLQKGLCVALIQQGLIHEELGDSIRAMGSYDQAEAAARAHGEDHSLQAVLYLRARAVWASKDAVTALALLHEQEEICRRMNHGDGLRQGLVLQGRVLYTLGDYDALAATLRRREESWQEPEGRSDLVVCFRDQIRLSLRTGQEDDLARCLRGMEERLHQDFARDALVEALFEEARDMAAARVFEPALSLLSSMERLGWGQGLHECILSAMDLKAVILNMAGRPDEAISVLVRQEQLCREWAETHFLVGTLFNHALTLWREMKRPDSALSLAREACEVARKHGYQDLAEEAARLANAVSQALHAPGDTSASSKGP